MFNVLVSNGGLLIVVDGRTGPGGSTLSQTYKVLVGGAHGLIHVGELTNEVALSEGAEVTVDLPDDPLVAGIASPYHAPNFSVAYTLSSAGWTAPLSAAGGAVTLHFVSK